MTERQHAEQERALLAAIVDSSDDSIISVALDGTILTWNQGAVRLYGYAASEAIGKPISLTAFPEQHAEIAEILSDVARGRRVRLEETIRRRSDGARVVMSLSVSPIRGADGSVTSCSAIAHDLNEKRALEAQLRQAQKLEAVGRLAGGVAHDFNNVLAAILSYAEIARDGLDPDHPTRADLEEILSAARRATNLTRQLLMFSRKQVLAPARIRLDEVMAGMDKMLRRLIGEDVEIVTRIAPSLPSIMADPGSIEQLLMNLAVNARDAMPDGGRLTIEVDGAVLGDASAAAHLGARSGEYARLRIGDTGVGMDAETQARMFEPFFTTKPRGQGTGLGLSTVFGIVQQSQGYIEVESQPGRGTTFQIHLPAAPSDGMKEATANGRRVSRAPPGNETILLVEDDAVLRRAAAETLRRAGYRVLVAGDGGEAMRVCEQHGKSIDLLLTDVVMPQESGPQIARRVTESYPSIRVLYMSGYTDDEVVRRGVFEGKVAYLQKPFTSGTLAKKVRQVLDGRDLADTRTA